MFRTRDPKTRIRAVANEVDVTDIRQGKGVPESRTVLVTDYMGDDTRVEEEILSVAGIDVIVAPSRDPQSWLDIARNADGILTRHAPITADTIGRLTRCRIISRYGTGTDNIDVAAAEARGIRVKCVEAYSTSEVADHAWAMALTLWRSIPLFHKRIVSGGWQPDPLPKIRRLRGQTLGLVGFGRIAAGVASRAQASGMEVVAYDPYATIPHDVSRVLAVDELIAQSDIISLHAPLTNETRHIVNDHSLASANGSILINASRGALLDMNSAIDALDHGRLTGLGLDVFEDEPLPIASRIRSRSDVLLTPHIGYYSIDSLHEAKVRSTNAIVNTLAEPKSLPL